MYSALAAVEVQPAIEQEAARTLAYDQRWLDCLADLYGYSFVILRRSDEAGRIKGLLPLCRLSSPVIGRRVVALPFTDHCPLLAEDDQTADALIEDALAVAHEYRARYLELRTGPSEVLTQRPDLHRSDLYVQWTLSLAEGVDAIWKRVHEKYRQSVRQTQKRGISVRLAETLEDVDHYYRLHLKTRSQRHGMPAQPRQFFHRLWQAFLPTGQICLYLAEHEGRVIAGNLILTTGSVAHGLYAASDPEYLHLNGIKAAFWTAFEQLSQRGCTIYDFGRTARDNPGLMDFKYRWGAEQRPLPYYYYPQTAGLASTRERSWKVRLLTGGWQRLPLPLAEALGTRLYAHLG